MDEKEREREAGCEWRTEEKNEEKEKWRVIRSKWK